MQKRKFLIIDRCLGGIVFLIAAITYILTIEPSASLWDCPEFITCGYKLEIGHSPGAPFFMLMTNLFAMFASNSSEVALWANILSALLSAGCILLLFLTITHLVRRLAFSDYFITKSQVLLIETCGLVGALVYAWSDTFWFSAVEAEVYAFSSFLTALIFWIILKWEEAVESPKSDRLLILISYIIGLSTGVHLLCLLCIPPIVLLVYYKICKKVTVLRTIAALLIGVMAIAIVLFGIIPGIVNIGSWFELIMTNTIGLPYNAGLITYATLLTLGFIIWIRIAKKRWWHTTALCFMVFTIGYSCYAIILVRASANPPMNENSPDNVFALASYLSREQYGDKPLLYGPAYTSEVDYETQGPYLVPKTIDKGAVYQKSHDDKADKYIEVNRRSDYIYRQNMLFPRMHSARHTEAYEQWMNGVDKNGVLPTQIENIRFFLSYQVNHMYLRYFFWNFVGRQNNIQGFGDIEHGNWITGFKWIDDLLLGCDTSKMPSDLLNNKGRNVFYGLPLLLGILGMLWQIRRGKRGKQQWNIVALLFFMTGLAIVLYLNQTVMEPRERDYAYAGSFYVFAIWVGMGVAELNNLLKHFVRKNYCVIATALIALIVPIQMVSQTWDDHDRSNRYICRDFGANYLNTMQDKGNPIILTSGDNDTFPLWYNQEVEGVRTDARVCNMSYAQTDWYIDQLKRPAYNSPSLPITWERKQYTEGTNEIVPIEPNDSITLQYGQRSMTILLDGLNHLAKSDLLIIEMLSHTQANRPIYTSINTCGNTLPYLRDHLVLEGLAYRVVPENAGKLIDIERLYDNIMNKYKYGGLSKQGLYVDDDAMGMAHIHQYLMSILINSLLENGALHRAKKVADKWQKELPSYNVPYTDDALAMAECYYLVSDVKKADEIVSNLLFRSSEWLNWEMSLGDKRSRSSERQWMGTLKHALFIAEKYKRKTLVKKYSQQYENFKNKFSKQ